MSPWKCVVASIEEARQLSLSNADVAQLLLVLVLLLIAAHSMGRLFSWLHQPKVAGEILGGLVLGPTIFGMVAPQWQQAVFMGGRATAATLGTFYQLGLFLLMYSTGAELRSILARRERKASVGIALVANAAPFIAGVVFLLFYDATEFLGDAQNKPAFLLVFALAMAVTSIPVISRIMADLGILGTRFARIVLSVAVLEDLLVYAVLNFALAMVAPPHAETFSLPGLLGLQPTSAVGDAYYITVTLACFALPALLGSGFVGRLASWRINLLHSASPIAFQLIFVLALTGLVAFLGVSPIFGALLAGMLAGDMRGDAETARHTIQSFAYACFIPIYFAVVGLRLDLVHHFDLTFFVLFLGFACLIKSVSAYAGARLAGEDKRGARNLAVALNARGGPGIVLATVALDAGIINLDFYTILVMIALVTSVLAGSWLQATLRRGHVLLSDPAKPETAPILN
jgi:Kef-type K+ transport system membrane component KefB